MVNILPPKEKRNLTLAYWLRLFSIAAVSASIVVLVGALLLVPSYFASRDQADAYERFRNALEGSVGLKDRDQVQDTVRTLNERVRLVGEYADSAFSVGLFEDLLKETAASVSITDIAFGQADVGVSVRVSGTADTREALLAFVDRLRKSPSFKNVTIPVSQLVAEEDASFTIEATYEKR